MDTIDPLSALPAPWLAAIEAYAPRVLAWLLIVTVLVHLLVPIARAVERWAVASSVTWDDGPARWVAERIEWLAKALRAVLAYLPRLAIGGIGQRDLKPGQITLRTNAPSVTTTPTEREIGERMAKQLGAERKRADRLRSSVAWCTATCDHDSPCTLPAGHTGGHETEHGCIAYDARPTRTPPSSGAGLALALIIVAAALSVAVSACSAGPQLPIVTTPITITCSWTAAPDGGAVTDNDCMVDRATSNSSAETTGNRARDVTVSPDITTSVSAIP